MNFHQIEKYLLIDIIGAILFKIVLDCSYISFVEPMYDYKGFYLDFDLIKYTLGWMVYLLLFMLLYRHKNHLLSMTLFISFLILIVPTITLFSLRNESYGDFYAIVLPYALMLLGIATQRVRIYYLPYGKQIAIGIAMLMVGIVFFHYLRIVGFDHINFDLSKVYELRGSDIGKASEAGIYGYLNSWVTKVFNIFLIAIALLRRKYFLVFLFVSIQILLFGFSGHKSVLFSLVLLVGLFFVDKIKHQTTVILYGSIALVALALLYFQLLGELMLPSILIRRAFFVPADLNYIYFDFFSSTDFIYWSHSILKNIFTYPYETMPVYVIGDFLGYPEMAANTGIFGTGYMHFGILGILLYLFVATLLINLVQQLHTLPYWVINTVVLMPFISIFLSADLPTALLTHGLFVSIILLYLYSSPHQKERYS